MIKDVVPSISEIPCFYSNDTIDWYKEHYSNACDWSLYELVTVHCIAEDELPSDSQIHDKVALLRNIGSSSYVDDMKKLINWYKSQILKP